MPYGLTDAQLASLVRMARSVPYDQRADFVVRIVRTMARVDAMLIDAAQRRTIPSTTVH